MMITKKVSGLKSMILISVMLAGTAQTSHSQQWNLVGGSTLTTVNGSYTNLVRSNNGDYYVSYYGGGVSKGSVQKYNGTSWSFVGSQGVTPGFATYNGLAVNALNELYYSFQDGSNSNQLSVKKYNPVSNAWTDAGVAISGAVVNYQNIRIVPSSNLPVVSYNNSGIRIKRYDGISAWSDVGTSPVVTGNEVNHSMVVSNDDTVFVAVQLGTGYAVYKNHINAPATVAWQLVGNTAFTSGGNSNQFTVSLAIDSRNRLYLAYRGLSNPNQSKIEVYTYTGTSWQPLGNQLFSANAVEHIAIAVTSAGIPTVAFRENNPTDKTMVYTLSGNTWVSLGAASVNLGNWNSLVLDNGIPVVAFCESSAVNGGLVTVKKYAPSNTIDSVRVNTLNNVAPIVTSSTLSTQAASVLQLEAHVYPSLASQSVSWSIPAGNTAAAGVNAGGLVTVPVQTQGIAWAKAVSAVDASKSDSLMLQVYCRPSHTNPINWFVIDTVQVLGTTLFNTTTALGNANAYQIFPEIGSNTATLNIGSTYTLKSFVTFSYGVQNTQEMSYSLWIDYNRNGIFENSEWTQVAATTFDSLLTAQFTVPAGARPGKTMMRVRSRVAGANNGAADACSAFNGSGQTKDFVITLAALFPVTADSVVVRTQNNVSPVITTNAGTLHMEAAVYPLSLIQDVTWSVAPLTGTASISSTGQLTAITNGTVYAKAVSVFDPTKSDSILVTISNQTIDVTAIDVRTANNASPVITLNGGTLQIEAEVLPLNATNRNVIWSIVPVSGAATISTNGLVTAIADGVVYAKAVAAANTGLADSVRIDISNQVVAVTEIKVQTVNNAAAVITTNSGTLQVEAVITPSNATNRDVSWTIVLGTGTATISGSGLVTAFSNGTVYARAASLDNASVTDSLEIIISNQGGGTDITALNVLNARVYPNPVTNTLIIDVPFHKEPVLFSLTDVCGKVVLKGVFTEETLELSVQDLAAGMYLLQLSGTNGTFSTKIIKD